MNKQREAIYRLRRESSKEPRGADWILRVVEDIVGCLVDRTARGQATRRVGRAPRSTSSYGVLRPRPVDRSASTGTTVNRPDARGAARPQAVERLLPARGRAARRRRSSRSSSAFCCSRPSTTSGRTTCSPSTTSRRASGCAATASATRWSSTRGSRSCSSRTMKERIEDQVVQYLFRAQPVGRLQRSGAGPSTMLSHPEAAGARSSRTPQQERAANTPDGGPSRPSTVRRTQPKVGRNDPCPCGSGKKYKKCHGARRGGGR